MALSNAERQRRYRERQAAGERPVRYRVPRDTRSRPARWRAAVETLRELQTSYEAWRENLPPSLESSATADRLDAVCELDIEQLDIELPRGFGRD